MEGILAVGLLVDPQRAVSAMVVAPEKLEPYVGVLARLYGGSLVSSCAVAFLCAPLPNVLPCKRNAGLGLMVYHVLTAIHLWHNRNVAGLLQPNVAYTAGGLHVVMALAFYMHWNVSGRQVKEFSHEQKKSK